MQLGGDSGTFFMEIGKAWEDKSNAMHISNYHLNSTNIPLLKTNDKATYKISIQESTSCLVWAYDKNVGGKYHDLVKNWDQ